MKEAGARRPSWLPLVLLSLAAVLGAAAYGSGPSGSGSALGPHLAASAVGISYEFTDFFNVPYGEWWDYRARVYGDAPLNAECFSAVSIADGVCTPSNANVPDVAAYPYTSWRPFSDAINPQNPASNPSVYAPYRMRAVATGAAGYSLREPVFVPVFDYGSGAGARLEFDWRMQYLDKAGADALAATGCPVSARSLDGLVLRSQVSLTMDLQESRRIFNVEAADAAQATAWWSANTDPTCVGQGSLEVAVHDWFLAMGGSRTAAGKYDVANALEYPYTPFYTQIAATVDAAGVTRVTLDHVAWGTEVLLARMFYWGNASYVANHRDSTRAAGWAGMEVWLEDLVLLGAFTSTAVDFTLTAAVPYHLQHVALPGPNGQFDRTDDVPVWVWGPTLLDRRAGWDAVHAASELDRYPEAAYTDVHATPGSQQYGDLRAYDYAPVRWDLPSGVSWRARFPTGNVVFFDPNRTPIGANPRGGYVATATTLEYLETRPATYGAWDASKTWDVAGPAATGGPEGSPGPDGLSGTPDDRYALERWGAIRLAPSVGPAYLRATTSPAVPGKILVDGIPRDEWGLTWVKLSTGPHTVSFGEVYGLGTPAPVSVVLRSGQTNSVQGSYDVYGSLRVTTDPAVGATILVNGEPANEWGMWRAVPAGSYTVSFGKVAGFDPPAAQTVNVAAGQFVQVVGRFTSNPGAKGPDPLTFGYLRVTTRPAVPSQIVANGIPRDEWGLTWLKVAPGDYVITFKGVYGHASPGAATVRVVAGQTTAYEGVFQPHGSLRVTTSPALPATISVDGVPRNDWGMWQSMPPGSYVVSFESVAGYVTPSPRTVTVVAGQTTMVTGTYTAAPSGADPDPSALRAAPPEGPTTRVVGSSPGGSPAPRRGRS
ncbi:MAG: hypothetical protein ACT4OI_02255 [Methanobacteriota archaeon]